VNINCKNNNVYYTGRCPQIRDAEWVCHTVNTAFPHVSTTKIKPFVQKAANKNSALLDKFLNNAEKNDLVFNSSEDFNILKVFDWYKHLITKLHEVRINWTKGHASGYSLLNGVIGQLEHEKLGNCGEDAYLSHAILKLNGVGNAYTARLQADGNHIDHSVCVFNKDNSIFDGKVNKNTIIIDPWLGCADFAPNMFVKYKNLCKKYFPQITPKSQIGFQNIKSIDLSGEEQLLLLLKYDKFCYPSCDRVFMQ